MTAPIIYEQTSMWGEPANDNAGGFITAMGRTLHIEQFAVISGIDAQTIRSRLRSGWSPDEAVTRPYTPTNKRHAAAFSVPWGAPGSFTWDHVPYELDIWAQTFVREHQDGAVIEEICEACGLEDSQARDTIQSALGKLRGLVLDGDEAARELMVGMFGDDVLETLMERFGDSAPSMEADDDADEFDAGPLFQEAA